MIKYLYCFLFSVFLVFIAQSITSLKYINNLNLILVALVFITIVWGFNLGFIFAIFMGFLLNLYSYLPLGTFIVIYLIIIGLVNFLYKHILINFSFVTNLILIVLASILYGLLLALFNYLFFLIGFVKIYILMDGLVINKLLWQVVFNAILTSVIFIIARIFYKRLNSVFLIKK